jgi:hypothetical protein
MTLQLQIAFLSVALVLPAAAAQQTPQPQSPRSTEKVQLPKSQLPPLDRQTRADDKVPTLDFAAYFVGKWNFTWDVPEGPLGPAGTITGTTLFKAIEGKYYEATSEATGPAGPLKMTEVIGYLPDQRAMSRLITDSRGFSILQIGTIGGDLGGYFNIYYESAPFTVNGKSVRLKSAMRLLSPVNFRVQTTISVDGGPFTNFGNPWWRKDVPGVTMPR